VKITREVERIVALTLIHMGKSAAYKVLRSKSQTSSFLTEDMVAAIEGVDVSPYTNRYALLMHPNDAKMDPGYVGELMNIDLWTTFNVPEGKASLIDMETFMTDFMKTGKKLLEECDLTI